MVIKSNARKIVGQAGRSLKRGPFVFRTVILAVVLGLIWWSLPAYAQESADPLVIETTVSSDSVWWGEPLLWKCCLWRCIKLNDNPAYLPPTTDGFVALAAPQHDRDTQRHGRPFVGNELSMHLIPQRTGTLQVGAVQIRVPRLAIDMMAMVEFADFFDSLFKNTGRFEGTGGDQALLASPPVDINVKPLPQAGRPACFSGAVGQFEVNARLDRLSLHSDEPLILELHVKGQGNVALIEPPEDASFPGFRLLQQRAKGGFAPFEADDPDGILAGPALAHMAKPEGERVFIYTLMAEKSGHYEITPPAFAYFDPTKESYVTVRCQALPVDIKPALSGNALPLGPQLRSAREEMCSWSGRSLSGMAVLMVFPLAGLAFWLYNPAPQRWTVKYMQRRIRSGESLYQLWLRWQKAHWPGEFDRGQVEAYLQESGVEPYLVTAFSAAWRTLEAERFSGGDANKIPSAVSAESLLPLLAKLDRSLASQPAFQVMYSRASILYRRYRQTLALSVAALSVLVLIVLTLVWGWLDYRGGALEEKAQSSFEQGNLRSAERLLDEAYAIHGRQALYDYNRGCLAWQRGQYGWAHFLFSRACANGGRAESYAAAWKGSAAQLDLQSWRAPESGATIEMYWLWSFSSLSALFCLIQGRKRWAYLASVVALVGLLGVGYEYAHRPLVMLNGESALHVGPGARYQVVATTKEGALAVVAEEKGQYLRLETVVGQDEFARLLPMLAEKDKPQEKVELWVGRDGTLSIRNS